MTAQPPIAYAVLLSLFGGVCHAQWVREPTTEQLRDVSGLVHESFESGAMNTTVGYSVVLPPAYNVGEDRYPVVYWLHGGGGHECSSLYTSEAWRQLYELNKIQQVILVYPNGFRSGYMDHYDGRVMVESMILQELIPRIDRDYRTIADQAGRAVHGFSMGASGSLKFAIKYPDMFSAAVAYGGGAIDLEQSQSRFILDILKRNLNSDPDLIRKNNTYRYLEQNSEALRENEVRFLLICGEQDSWKESAVLFQEALRKKGLPCRLALIPEAGHDLRKLSAAAGRSAAIFQDLVFSRGLGKAN